MLTTKKSTTGGREFHTFITLSAKKFLRAVFVVCGLYSLYAWPLVFKSVPNEKKIIKTDINHAGDGAVLANTICVSLKHYIRTAHRVITIEWYSFGAHAFENSRVSNGGSGAVLDFGLAALL